MELYKKFDVELQFRGRLFGVQPKTEKLIEQYAEAKGLTPEAIERMKSEVDLVDEAEIQEELVAKTWVGFFKDEKGLYKKNYQVRGMIKEAAKVLKLTTKVKGLTNLLQHGFFVKPERIHLGHEEPDGYDDKAGRVTGRMGPRSILTRADYVEKAKIVFKIWVLDTGVLSDENLKSILEHCQEMGFGGRRSYEEGKFDLVKFDKIKEKDK